jgi:hypothetical protein
MPAQNSVATFLLAIDEGGSVLGFSSEDNPQGDIMLREAATRASVNASLVRVEMPLPPGAGSATVVVLDEWPHSA